MPERPHPPTRLGSIAAVVFDLDGTLVEVDYDWPAIRARLGAEEDSIIDQLNGLAEPERTARWRELEAIERRASAGARLRPGARALLELLRERGLGTALVTNNSAANAGALLARFGLGFDLVLTRDDGLWKPSGAPLSEAMRRLGVRPKATLAVGDSHFDLEAARKAGCGVVCIVGRREDRLASAADLTLPDLVALERRLRAALS